MKDINLRLRGIAAMADPKSEIGIAINLLLKDVELDQKKRASQCERTRRCVAKKREANVSLTVSLTPHPNTLGTTKREANGYPNGYPNGEANELETSLYVKEDKNISFLEESKKVSKKVSKIQRGSLIRGTRLPDDWRPSEEDRKYALEAGIPESAIDREAEEFVDFWTSLPGSKALKLDWHKTWKRRIRQISDRYKPRNNFIAKPLTPYQKNQAEWKERLDAVAKFAYGDDAAQQNKPKNGGPLDASDAETFPFGGLRTSP